MKMTFKALFAGVFCCLAAVGWAGAADYAYRMEIRPGSAAQTFCGEKTCAGLPVLLRLGSDVGSRLQSAGAPDFMILDENGTELPFEFVSRENAGNSFVWARVPSFSTNTVLTAYFGGAANTGNQATNVWQDYVGVWHYKPSDVSETTIADAAGNGLDATNAGTFSAYAVDCPFGLPALKTSSGVTAADYDSKLTNVAHFTAIGWFKMPNQTSSLYANIVNKKGSLNWSDSRGWYLEMSKSTTTTTLVMTNTKTYSLPDVTQNWNYFSIISDGSSIKAYFNGSGSANINWSPYTVTSSGNGFKMGGENACLSEYRLYNGAMSVERSQFEYKTMAESGFLACGPIYANDPQKPAVAFDAPAVGASSVTLSGTLLKLGETASSVSVKIAFASVGSATMTTNTLCVMTSPGDFSETIGGLTTGTDYNIAYWVENNIGKISDVTEKAIYVAPQIDLLEPAGYVSGLKQAKFNVGNGDATWTTKTLADSVIDVEITPGAGMASVEATESNYSTTPYTNPYTGNSAYWNKTQTTFAYIGEMYFEAGKTYVFGKMLDDAGYVKIGATEVLKDTTYNAFAKKTYVPEASGWQSIDVRAADGTGGKGPSGTLGKDAGGNNLRLGMAYNDENVTTAADTAWKKIMDPGDMSVLRSPLPTSYMGMGSLDVEGTDAKVWLRFANVPRAAELYACYGGADGGVSLAGWANKLKIADIPAGDTRATLYTAAGVASSACVRFALLVPGSATEQRIEQFSGLQSFTQVAPAVVLNVVSVGYTNIDYSATLEAFGVGGTEATLTAELSASDDFAVVLQSKNLGTFTSLASVPFVFDVLTTNTCYSARVRAVNDRAKDGVSNVASATTLTPTLAVGTSVLTEKHYTSLKFRYELTDYGDDSSDAEVWIDLSKSGDFDDTLSFGGEKISAALPTAGFITATGLEGDTSYRVRLRLVNSWKLVSLIGEQSVRTYEKAYKLSPIGAVSVGSGFSVSLLVSDIPEGATVYVNASSTTGEAQNWTITEPSTLTLDVAGVATVTYTVTAKIGGEDVGEPTVIARTLTKGASDYVLASFEDLHDVYPVPGDSVILPDAGSLLKRYVIDNDAAATLDADGRTVHVLRAGGTGIALVNSETGSDVRETMKGLIVAAVPEGSGKCYLLLDQDSDWAVANRWLVLANGAASVASDYPRNADDVAMIINRSVNNGRTVLINEDITIGELYCGSLYHNTARNFVICSKNNSTVRTLTFAKSDPKSVCRVQVCNSTIGGEQNFVLISNNSSTDRRRTAVVISQDTVFDGGYFDADTNSKRRNRFLFGNCDFTVAEGAEMRFENCNPVHYNFETYAIEFWGSSSFSGAGTVRNVSAGNIVNDANCRDFTGRFVDSTYKHAGYDRTFDNQMRANYATNAILEVAGFVSVDPLYGIPWATYQSGGTGHCSWSGCGNVHGYGSTGTNRGNVFDWKEIYLRGGFISIWAEANGGWVDKNFNNQARKIIAQEGVSGIGLHEQSAAANPTNNLTIATLANTNGAMMVMGIPRMVKNTTTELVRADVWIRNFSDIAIGPDNAEGITDGSGRYGIVPWLVGAGAIVNAAESTSDVNANSFTVCFIPAKYSDGQVRGPYRKSEMISAFADDANATIWQTSLALGEDKALNSLNYRGNDNDNNQKSNCNLGEGRTLTLTSGGLILSHAASIGQSATAETTAGTIAFPSVRGYIWAIGDYGNQSDARSNQIWAKLDAPKGLSVFTMRDSSLFTLGGVQPDIKGDITVNRGRFFFGTAANPLKVGCDLNIVGAKSVANMTANDNLSATSLVRFVDTADHPGKMNIAAGVSAQCFKLYIGSDFGPRKAMTRGTYGATGSGAQFIDDEHFSGTGVLNVRRDDHLGFKLILR